MKRLILLCDGTLQDAESEVDPDLYTNVAKLSRAISEVDERSGQMVEQIKYYQSGVGTDEAAIGGIVTGALGRGMMQKVKDLYDFLALNWEVGDEVYLFGFSRGAYTVRLLTSLLGDGGNDDEKAVEEIRKLLAPLSAFRSRQMREVRERGGGFLVKSVGVFDTVATRGRPSSLRPRPKSSSPIRYNSFGIDETLLEPCVELAFQALALDELRVDYVPVVWRQDSQGEARRRGQRLLQVWFSGAHADIGGGYKEQDLSYLTLTWMVAQLQNHLAFNYDYLKKVERKTTEGWGRMEPHQSRIGEFRLAAAVDRPIPSELDPSTNQYFHPSILAQPRAHLREDLLGLLSSPELFVKLSPIEQRLKDFWPAPSGSGGTKPTQAPKREEKEKDPLDKAMQRPVVLKSQNAPVAPSSPPVTKEDSHSDSASETSSPPPSRPSSVTSFTDNESPPPSPSSSSASPSLSSSVSSLAASDVHEPAPPSPEELFPLHRDPKHRQSWLQRVERKWKNEVKHVKKETGRAAGRVYS
ncbi:hypothetical protein JCM10213_005252 [Rhodosporidiobolus nylandii]